jgi:hypothetical protein
VGLVTLEFQFLPELPNPQRVLFLPEVRYLLILYYPGHPFAPEFLSDLELLYRLLQSVLMLRYHHEFLFVHEFLSGLPIQYHLELLHQSVLEYPSHPELQ